MQQLLNVSMHDVLKHRCILITVKYGSFVIVNNEACDVNMNSNSNEKGTTQVMACYSKVCCNESINYTMGQMYMSVAATKTVLIKTFIILPHMKKSTCQWLYIVCSPSLFYLNIECQLHLLSSH